MTLPDGIVLGLIQGLTEFLPVSSSGHLAIAEHVLGVSQPLGVTVLLHFGTLLSLVVFYWRDLRDLGAALLAGGRKGSGEEANPPAPVVREAGLVMIATLPAVAVGLAFKHRIEGLFQASSLTPVACFLLLSGLMALVAQLRSRPGDGEINFSWARALFVGCGQALAILPGLSRSGTTIAFSTLAGLDRAAAPRFAFLMAIPAILGANLLEFRELEHLAATDLLPALAGTVVAAVMGLIAIRVVYGALRRASFYWFAAYCWVVGAALLISGR